MEESSVYERSFTAANGFLNRAFASCADDPRGSVHRAWGVSLIFVILYFVISVVESKCILLNVKMIFPLWLTEPTQ